jgi:hypothetical protein
VRRDAIRRMRSVLFEVKGRFNIVCMVDDV